jgi:hypothetical protein
LADEFVQGARTNLCAVRADRIVIRVESSAVVELENGTTKQALQLREGDQLAGGGAVLSDAVITHVELERVTFSGDKFRLRVPPDQGVVQGQRQRYGRRLSMDYCATFEVDRSSLTIVDRKGRKRVVTFAAATGYD